MSALQQAIGSGFGFHSTAEEILEGIDLAGRLAIVTGGASGLGLGLGLETTRALTAAGASVVVGARRTEAAHAAVTGLPRVQVVELDLGDLSSVQRFADRVLDQGSVPVTGIDMLINNAGVMAASEQRVGPGWESQFAINHLGHFALTNRLWPALAQARGRVVAVSSAGHHDSAMRWDDVHFTTGYDKWLAYGQSKTASALFAVGLDRRGAGTGVRAFSVHPGKILTDLVRHLQVSEMAANGWVDDEGTLIDPTFKTPAQGAATQVWAATAPGLTGFGGLYCEDCEIAGPAPGDGQMVGVCSYAVDLVEAEQLWTYSADLTGLDAFTPAGRCVATRPRAAGIPR